MRFKGAFIVIPRLSKLLLLTLCCMSLGAIAQVTDAFEASLGAQQQLENTHRLVIDVKRQQLQSGFVAEDVMCYKRFAVNNCLHEINARRTASLADLRRQDILLNDQERKRRGFEEIRHIETKQTDANQQELTEKRAQIVSEYEARAQVFDQRQGAKLSTVDAERAAAQARVNRLKTAEIKAEARRIKQLSAPQEAAKLRVRQVEAEKRRAEHVQQQVAKQSGPVKSLPTPP